MFANCLDESRVSLIKWRFVKDKNEAVDEYPNNFYLPAILSIIISL